VPSATTAAKAEPTPDSIPADALPLPKQAEGPQERPIPPHHETKPSEHAKTAAAPVKPVPEPDAPSSPPIPQAEPAPARKPEPPPKAKTHPNLSLNLDLPGNFVAPPGLSTAAIRPPDITRSGENDEFGRRVIRALRGTMPPPRGEIGRVTVRILLSPTGNLAEVQLIRPATDPLLTQNVVFAVKQTNFPFPPKGATVSDRTFLVTYIYN
jgi:TonB family protein